MYPTRPRRTNSSQGTLLNTIRANTVTFETSFYCRALRTWNTLPAHLRNVDYSVVHFKNEIFNYYLYLTKSVYDVDTPKTYKSVSQRGRRKEGEGGWGGGESEKRERESINQTPSLFPDLPIPYPRLARQAARVLLSSVTLFGHWPGCSIKCVVDSFINVSYFCLLLPFLLFLVHCHYYT